jgi:hypothetical protein
MPFCARFSRHLMRHHARKRITLPPRQGYEEESVLNFQIHNDGCHSHECRLGTNVDPDRTGGGEYQAIACSADGKTIITGSKGNTIYLSTNSGTAWSRTIFENGSWHCATCSADGSKIFVEADYPFIPRNSGLTWATNYEAAGYCLGVACSGDAGKVGGCFRHRTATPIHQFWHYIHVQYSSRGRSCLASALGGVCFAGEFEFQFERVGGCHECGDAMRVL